MHALTGLGLALPELCLSLITTKTGSFGNRPLYVFLVAFISYYQLGYSIY
jgi:hypothetical protein